MSPAVGKRLRLLASALSVLALLALAFGGWFYFQLRRSLPALEGEIRLQGLGHAVVVERDAQGVPTIKGEARTDVAQALGFLHAQERFFQMDLARRRSAGELSALFGPKALEVDKAARMHGFRRLAQATFARLPAAQRALLEAYATGVNSGLANLGANPFEYLLLRTAPQPWKPEDSVLLIYTMTLDLQDDRGGYEQSLAAVRDRLGESSLAFFAPQLGPDDAALDDSRAPLPTIPPASHVDLRNRQSAATTRLRDFADDTVLPGSNSFALSSTRSAGGGALVANDMHLTLRVPNIWYRALLVFPGPGSGKEIRLTGVTLPGTPLMIAGSNGHIAWGFTNANADVSDLVPLDRSTLDPSVYIRGGELLSLETRRETIEVKGSDAVEHEIAWSVFGPIVGTSAQRKPLALKWTMHDPDAANFDLMDLETTTTVEDALRVANRCGIPVQNFVVADQHGSIGWTLCGRLPRRSGFDGRLPVPWTFGDRGWEGFLPAEEYPAVVNPPAGQLWTANQRLLGGEALRLLGDGGYERPARAARIRELLTPLPSATAADLLGIQLDTGAPHLDRWHSLLQRVLTTPANSADKRRTRLLETLGTWDARAEVESVSYRHVRRFRHHVVNRVLPPIFEPCVDVHPGFSYRRFHYEPALWALLEQRPEHLLDPAYASWDHLLSEAVDAVIRETEGHNLTVQDATWGKWNTARIEHPFVGLIPGLSSWLSLPRVPLPGDYDTPRVQAPNDGASERFVVSPGREQDGIFHMPAGQSSHPLSPYFSAGHEAWVRGEATPFLPGPAKHTLRLQTQP